MGLKSIVLWMAEVISRRENHEAQASGFAGEVFDSKLLHLQGMVSGVPNETKVIAVQLGEHRNKSYLLPFKITDLAEIPTGSIRIYATNESGSQTMGCIELTHDGKLSIATNEDDLLEIIKGTLALIQELKTFGSPTTQQPSPEWVGKAKKLEQRLESMRKEGE